MDDKNGATNYPVTVSRRGANYELRIKELLLVVRGADLAKAYEALLERKQKIIDWARENDAVEELPYPARIPLLGEPGSRATSTRTAFGRLFSRHDGR